MTRAQRTEAVYRNELKTRLLALLEVVNPQDQMTWGTMKFEDLVVYCRDWLDTEIEELGLKNHIILRPLPKLEAPTGLSL